MRAVEESAESGCAHLHVTVVTMTSVLVARREIPPYLVRSLKTSFTDL